MLTFGKNQDLMESLSFQKFESNSTKSSFQMTKAGKCDASEEGSQKNRKQETVLSENENNGGKIKFEYGKYLQKITKLRRRQRQSLGENKSSEDSKRPKPSQTGIYNNSGKKDTREDAEGRDKSKKQAASSRKKINNIDRRKTKNAKSKKSPSKKDKLDSNSKKRTTLESGSLTTNDEHAPKSPPKRASGGESRQALFEKSDMRSNFLSQATTSDSEKVSPKAMDGRRCGPRPSRRTKSNSRSKRTGNKRAAKEEARSADSWVSLLEKKKKHFGLNLESCCLKTLPTVLISNSTEMVVLEKLKLSAVEFDFSLKEAKKLIFGAIRKLENFSENLSESNWQNYHFIGLNEDTPLRAVESGHVLWLSRSEEGHKPGEKKIYVNEAMNCSLRKTINVRTGHESLQVYSSPQAEEISTVFLTGLRSGQAKPKKEYVKVDIKSEFDLVKLSRNKNKFLNQFKSNLSADKSAHFQMRELQVLPDVDIFWRVFSEYFGDRRGARPDAERAGGPVEFGEEGQLKIETIKSAPNLDKEFNRGAKPGPECGSCRKDCDVFYFRFGRKQIAKFRSKIKLLYRIRRKVSSHSQMKASYFSEFVLHKSRSKIGAKFALERPLPISLYGRGAQEAVLSEREDFILWERRVDVAGTCRNVLKLAGTKCFLKIDTKTRSLSVYKKLFFMKKRLLQVEFSKLIAAHRSSSSIVFVFRYVFFSFIFQVDFDIVLYFGSTNLKK